ncbi:MAG: serpin family protein, partial [Pseudonocardiaceae bacterium]
ATHGLIPALIGPDAIRATTAAIAVNALYLKVAWLTGFPVHATQPRPFHGPGASTDVPTMRLTARLGYAAVNGWQVLSLPAAGGVDAVLLLPDGDLSAAETAVDYRTLAAMLAAPEPTRVELFLPKFQVKDSAQLTEPLRLTGVSTMFTELADLSGISSTPVTVDQVLHEAVLTVDEQGLEGAAATAAAARLVAMVHEPEPVVVRADRPFLLLVRHHRTGVIYFFARIVRP